MGTRKVFGVGVGYSQIPPSTTLTLRAFDSLCLIPLCKGIDFKLPKFKKGGENVQSCGGWKS